MLDGAHAVAVPSDEGSMGPSGSIIFSQRDDHVWVSWDNGTGQVDLGPVAVVEEMMRDYLAQSEIATRIQAGTRST